MVGGSSLIPEEGKEERGGGVMWLSEVKKESQELGVKM